MIKWCNIILGLRLLISGPLKDETNDKALFVSSNIRCDAHSPIHILIKNKTDEVIELDAGVCIGQIVFVKEIVCAPTMMSNTVFQTLTHKVILFIYLFIFYKNFKLFLFLIGH